MTCLICKTGVMKAGFTNVVLSKGSATVVFKSVPARICDDCGEYWLDEAVATAMLDRLLHHAQVLSLKGASYRNNER